MKTSKSIKIYFSLLALCYLEVRRAHRVQPLHARRAGSPWHRPNTPAAQVVLWTSCLAAAAPLNAGAATDSHSYLIRETVSGLGPLRPPNPAPVPR